MIKYLRKKEKKKGEVEISRDLKNLTKERRKEKKEKETRRKSRKVKRN